MQRHTTLPPAVMLIEIPDDLWARIQNLAEARQKTPYALMLQALEGYIAREEQREAVLIEAKKAYNNFMLTGLHVTEEEADAWLAELEAGNDVEPPKCHI